MAQRKIWRRLWWLIPGFLGVVVLAVGVVFGLLATGVNNAFVARGLLDLANHAFRGRIEVGSAQVFPDGTFHIRGAKLHAPDGTLIATVEALDGRIELTSLLHQRVSIHELSLRGCNVALAQGGDGTLDIEDAFSPRKPSPVVEVPVPQPGWAVEIEVASLDLTRFRYQLATDQRAIVEVGKTQLSGRFALARDESIRIEAHLDSAQLDVPFALPVAGDVQLSLVRGVLAGEVNLHSGDSRLSTTASMSFARLDGSADVRMLDLTPAVLAQLVPGIALSHTVHIDGALQMTHGVISSDGVHARVEDTGNLTASGSFDPASGDAALSLQVDALDLSEVQAELPRSKIAINLSAKGRVVSLSDSNLAVTARLEPSLVRGVAVRGSLQARLEGRRLRVADLSVQLPGASVRVTGTATPAALDLSAEVTAIDLAGAKKAIDRAVEVTLPSMSGVVTVSLAATGKPTSPHLEARLASTKLSVAGLVGTGLAGEVHADVLAHPREVISNLHFETLQMAGRELHDVRVDGVWRSPDVALSVSFIQADGPVLLSAQLLMPDRFERIDVQALRLELPSGVWDLRQPFGIVLTRGVRVEHFELFSDAQRIGGTFAQPTNGPRTATAEASNLDLQKLPSALLPPDLGLHGLLDARATLQPAHGGETVHGELWLQEASVHGLPVKSARGEVTLGANRIAGGIDVRTSGGDLTAEVEAPAKWPPGQGTEPLSAKVFVHERNLAELRPLVSGLTDWDGQLDVSFTAFGSVGNPALSLTANGHRVMGPWVASADRGSGAGMDFDLSSQWDRSLSAQLEIHRAGGKESLLHLVGAVALPSAQAVHDARTRGGLRHAVIQSPFSLTLTSGRLGIEEALRAVGNPLDLRGQLQIAAQLDGSLAKPRGTVRLTGEALELRRYPLGKLALEVSAEEAATSAVGTLTLPEGLVHLEGHLALPPEKAVRRETLLAAPLRLHVDLASVPLHALLPPRAKSVGNLSGRATFDGSLRAPHGRADLALADVSLLDRPVGQAGLTLTWERSEVGARLNVREVGGGQLEGEAQFPFAIDDRSKPAPLRGTLSAQAFDLAFLSGMVRPVGEVDGRLETDLVVGGTLTSPTLTGPLALERGALMLSGFGLYRDISLSANLSQDRIAVERLTTRSGTGTATLSGSLSRTDGGLGAIEGSLDCDRFGVYVADQLRATLSTKATLSGTVGGAENDVTVRAGATVVKIPSFTARELGGASLSPDIVMVGDKPAGGKLARPWVFHLIVPGPLAVYGPEADLKGSADLWARLDPDLTVKGEVALLGTAKVFGRPFVVTSASAEFGDPKHELFGKLDDPYLLARAYQEANGIKILIGVDGRLPEPNLTLTSEPPMSNSELVSLLLGGAPGGPEQQGAAVGSLTGLLATQLVNKASGSGDLPIDVVSLSTARVEAGKRIGNSLYVSAAYSNDPDPRANAVEARASYQLGKSWTVDGKYGSAGAGAVNVEWRTNW